LNILLFKRLRGETASFAWRKLHLKKLALGKAPHPRPADELTVKIQQMFC